MRGTIIALSNQKGGVGKTTTCANLGIGLAMEGKKVLVVDADPQSSLSISLGYPQPDQLPVTITDLMKKVILDKPITEGEGILSCTKRRVWICCLPVLSWRAWRRPW